MILNATRFILFVCFTLGNIIAFGMDCPIIPQPKQKQQLPSIFVLDANVVVLGDESLQGIVAYLKSEVNKRTGIAFTKKQAAKKIQFISSSKQQALGSYQLNMSSKEIQIKATDKEGFFNGLNSLLQLIDASKKGAGSVPINCWSVDDAPRFLWRGFMLDEARHFFGIYKVKQLLDWMAYYKLNRFHWHLTDVQGWRLPIARYPDLTKVGGVGNFSDGKAAAAYYTKEQIQEIVSYAQERFITVIPEVDMPGHATAANKAYPAYNGGGSEMFPDFTFNPGYEKTYTFLTNILKETTQLFPSKMIHLGGDEVAFGAKAWEDNVHVKELMKSHNLKNIQEVEHYFTRRMADSIKNLKSKVLVWDEAVDGNLDPNNTLVFWWRHDKRNQLQKAIDKGFDVVLCPRLPMYFDFVQDEQHQIGRKWTEKYNALKNVYEFPTGDELYTSSSIKGIQANLWTETITSEKRFDFMIFPRIAALAEAAWTDQSIKNYQVFESNLKLHLIFYHQQGINYYDPFTRTLKEN
jgi:hexosaminidase